MCVTEYAFIHVLMAVHSCTQYGTHFHCVLTETAMDDSQLEDRYPLLNDLTFLPSFHEQLLKGLAQWSTPEMFATVQFMWAVLLRECAGRTLFAGEE